MTKYLVVIPARYESNDDIDKPLTRISSVAQLQKIYNDAIAMQKSFDNLNVVVATHNKKIKEFCELNKMKWVEISDDCKNGTEASCEAMENLKVSPSVIVNLQGYNHTFGPGQIKNMIKELEDNSELEVVTPGFQMNWDELDELKEQKKADFFTGTTCSVDKNNYASWFSKNMITSIRDTKNARSAEKSPIYKHIGIYGYKPESLKKYKQCSETLYEKVEGLEQLRFIENDIKIKVVK